MRTKVSTLCESIIEAGWLLAVIIVPLFFNVYSSRVFEPDKISLLRSIVMLMATAWLVLLAERRLRGGAPELSSPSAGSAWAAWLHTPLIAPALLMCLVYILATLTSIVPRVSLWGSYQRLQGTYSTLSYIVVFMLLVQNLRRREQLERLWTVIILTSLPIAFYGLVQHYNMDPLPWGGDVSYRVASNMGNAIFIGAYLIMVVPLTIARLVGLLRDAVGDQSRAIKLGLPILFVAVMAAQTWVWFALGLGRGLIVGLLAITMFMLVGLYLQQRLSRFALLASYGILLTIQLVCLIFSQSRGPILGLLAGLFFFTLFYLVSEHRRKIALGVIALAVVAMGLLVVMNLPDSPLAAFRKVPYIGRLGQLLETESGTGRVRVLIWQGAAEMLVDNPVRAVIGYGPEAMYVAYNPYYPPELAQIEARNASPDRSHNETFDALVTTGIIGFFAYVILFSSTFYFGLKYVGLIPSRGRKRLFVIVCSLGLVIGFLAPILVDHSLRYIGVGLPMGLMFGLFCYVTAVTIVDLIKHADTRSPDAPPSPRDPLQTLLISALIAAIIGHFVEIHLGIAIAATRTYFWTYAGLLVVLGMGWVGSAQETTAVEPSPAPISVPSKRSGRGRKSQTASSTTSVASSHETSLPTMTQQITVYGLLAGVILLTVIWDYTTNPLAEANPLMVLVQSFATLAAVRQPDTISLGMLWLLLCSTAACLVLPLAEIHQSQEIKRDATWWATSLGRIAALALVPTLIYALIHASRVGPRSPVSDLIFEYAAALLLMMLALVWALSWKKARQTKFVSSSLAFLYPLLLIAALIWNVNINISPIKADILYKQGLRYDQAGDWDRAIFFYQRAIQAAPTEDFFQLFNGRALMEKAKLATDEAQRDALFEQALAQLTSARDLNPLNTDHTANIARLYRTWGEMATDAQLQRARVSNAIEQYDRAIALSPNNAQLYNESGLARTLLGDIEGAKRMYEQSLALDDRFVQTYILLGDLALVEENWDLAIQHYERATELAPNAVQAWSALGYAYSQMQDWDNAILANEQVLVVIPNDYATLKNLAILYNQMAQPDQALLYAQRALEQAPEAEKAMVENFVQQLQPVQENTQAP